MSTTTADTGHSIDSILDQLERFQQRATYGAVAGLLKRAPRNLMGGRSRGPRDSWIVGQRDGLPTGYAADQLHPAIKAREEILSSPEDLERWLANPG